MSPDDTRHVSATTLLKNDHDEIRRMLDEFIQLDPAAGELRREVAARLITELRIHQQLEEQIFYPAIQRAHRAELDDEVYEGREEHHIIEILSAEIEAREPGEPEFKAKMQVLRESVEHHLREEEEELFPQVDAHLGDQLLEVGERMAALRGELAAAVERS